MLGAGSNTLFRDGGFDGVVIKLGNNFSYTKLINKTKSKLEQPQWIKNSQILQWKIRYLDLNFYRVYQEVLVVHHYEQWLL